MPPDRRARAALLVAASLAIACSDDDAPPAGDDAAADAATEPDAGLPGPEAPGSPELTPCPAGWSERAGEVVVCEPFDPAPAGCPAGSIQLPGEPDCRSLGADCPDGDFATGVEAPEGTVRYVLAGAPAGGSGAIDDPFGSIAEALGRSDRGDVLALSRGTFAESVELPEGVTLAGACAAETIVEAPTLGGVEGVVTVVGADAVVRDVQLTGPRPGLWIEGGRRSVRLEGVAIEGVELAGIVVGDGASATGSAVAVRDVTARAVPGVSGFGVLVDTRGSLELDGVAIEQTEGTAVMALGTHVALTDASIGSQVGQQPDVHGVEAQLGADVALTRCRLDGLRDVAVIGFDLDTSVTLQDVVIGPTSPRADGSGGRAIAANGSAVTARRVRIEGQAELAVIADGDDASLSLEDVVIRDTTGRSSDGGGGTAVVVQNAGIAGLTRVSISESRGVGVIVFAASSATLTDVSIRETRGLASDGDQGTGLQAQSGATVAGARVAIDRARQGGIIAIDGGSVRLEDVAVDETLARDCAADSCAGRAFGDGVQAVEGGTVELTRFRVRQGERVGVMVGGGSMDLHHGEVSGFPIGASVQLEAFDETRLFDDVVYRDNERNLDRSALPVPEPAVPF